MNEISISNLLKLSNPNIIDIRDNYTYNMGHIHNAKNIPYYSLLSNYSIYLKKHEVYYLYCDYGKQSMEISNRLNLFGYNTYYIKEGYLDFKNYL
ncbi:MAG: rhodanese-like domain-containing protein [Bacilli bacterium]|nr:rhodanese-like domain-containing protein [bacterium]MDY3934990.1 rhodanese-like domain-containing protein [Bacilli bacterium]